MASSSVKLGRGRLVTAVGIGMAVSAAIWGVALISPDRLLERSYARSAPLGTIHLDEIVSDGARALPVTKAANRSALRPALLIDGVALQTGVLTEPLVVGARVRLAPGTAQSRELEVLDAAEMDTPIVGLPGVRLQLVTLRPLDGDSESLQLVFAIRDGVATKPVPASSGPTSGKVL